MRTRHEYPESKFSRKIVCKKCGSSKNKLTFRHAYLTFETEGNWLIRLVDWHNVEVVHEELFHIICARCGNFIGDMQTLDGDYV